MQLSNANTMFGYACLLWVAPLLAADAPERPRLICCGGPEVFVIELPAEPDASPAKTWSWQAETSPEIDSAHHRWFATTDDCKPYGNELLITSSSGGVALVRREDRACRFYAASRNAHSACLLPGDRVAVAASTGGDAVQVFVIGAQPLQAQPHLTLPLMGAHGVEWDAVRNRLWALGSEELLRIEIDERSKSQPMRIEQRWVLPTHGGHDLSLTADGPDYYVTTDTAVYRFDTAAGTFAAYGELGQLALVKSVDQRKDSGEVVYHQAIEAHWWSDTIRFPGDRPAIQLPAERLYKLRWDQLREHRSHPETTPQQ